MSDDFTFQGQGTLLRVDSFVSKAGKPVVTLIFETKGRYPQLIPIKVFGRLAEEASNWKPGSVLAVNGRLGGRDWNGKVYGDMIANTVEVVGEGAAADERGGFSEDPRGPAPPPSDDDIPF
jgi:single-stranded DNA-binding protein